MDVSTKERTAIAGLVARHWGETPCDLVLESRPLRGGLESSSTRLVTARYRNLSGSSRVLSLVVKQVHGGAVREARVYQELVTRHLRELSPRLLSVEHEGQHEATLYLESVRPVRRWPWANTESAERVLERITQLHEVKLEPATILSLTDWDYEWALQESAEATLELLEQSRGHPLLSSLRQRLPALRRVVGELPTLRRQLLAFPPFGSGAVHGDVHPGNTLLRRRAGRHEPVYLDWGRARIGSPLEDVVSWLHSLSYWEPEARRRHDTLLSRYLSARGLDARPTAPIRAACWLAGASNALAGALRHHLTVAQDEVLPLPQREYAAHAARDWLRVIRRADAGMQ